MVLHAAAIALLLQVRRPEPDMPLTPSYELVFDNGGSAAPPTAEQTANDVAPRTLPADPAPAAEATPPEPAPTPTEPPQQQAMAQPDAPPPDPSPEPPPQPTQQAMAQPDALPPPAPPDVTPQPAEPAQPLPQATIPAPALPAVRLAQPEALPPSVTSEDLVPGFTPPVPPPPLPSLAPPRPRPPPRPAPRPALGSLGAPMDLNFGQASSRAPAPPRGSTASRAIDFSLGAPKPGPNKSEAFFDIRAANIGADWAQGLAVYWRKHRFYPRQAAESGEDGTVQIELVVNRLGRVESVEIKSRSGSPWLDMAALSTWRNAQLAPLPAENTDRTITIPLTINYLLIR